MKRLRHLEFPPQLPIGIGDTPAPGWLSGFVGTSRSRRQNNDFCGLSEIRDAFSKPLTH